MRMFVHLCDRTCIARMRVNTGAGTAVVGGTRQTLTDYIHIARVRVSRAEQLTPWSRTGSTAWPRPSPLPTASSANSVLIASSNLLPHQN